MSRKEEYEQKADVYKRQVYPLFVEYDRFANLMNGATKHLSPSKALQQLGFNIHWILGSGASGQSTSDAVWFGSSISVSLAFICALINLSIGVIVGSDVYKRQLQKSDQLCGRSWRLQCTAGWRGSEIYFS